MLDWVRRSANASWLLILTVSVLTINNSCNLLPCHEALFTPSGCSRCAVQTPQRLLPGSAQRWCCFGPLHHLPGWGWEPAAAGLLWHEHRRRRMDRKSATHTHTHCICSNPQKTSTKSTSLARLNYFEIWTKTTTNHREGKKTGSRKLTEEHRVLRNRPETGNWLDSNETN